MKLFKSTIKSLAVLGILLSFVGVVTVWATPAEPGRGTGCYVRISEAGEYAYDATCSAHDVLKFDDEGEFQFYFYQDQGQLPDGWRPSQTLRSTFELCYNFEWSVTAVCGRVTEVVTPSGNYKSSFKSY